MNSYDKPLLLELKKKYRRGSIPFWFMRQAGRYLPEYRELRDSNKNFLEFCYTPSLACEATLQPMRRFGMSAAIIFSDILVVPHALGMEVWFEEGKGPGLTPLRNEEMLGRLSIVGMENRLAPVYDALRLVKMALPETAALIGFSGSPWTLACYMVNGKGDRDFNRVKSLAARQRLFFAELLSLLSEAVAKHAICQIEAGAEVVQLFDSWAGVLSDQEFSEYVTAPTKTIVKTIKSTYPDIPIIGFPRHARGNYATYAEETKVDAISIDPSVSLNEAKRLQEICVVQGNLDPLLLAGDKNTMLTQARHIVSALADKPFVFNLGHGILPHTPVENVQALCDFLKAQ
ncbi:MAG: uroporphyrinogen decarboxylase [Pseudomonadota bacterium]|nr:uroporphyrinogen decarboxylase [Pseudomonadota bacterium]MDE3038348.1 uroporphyrinogen decarboxylase [Pseudomonadota bacterium]